MVPSAGLLSDCYQPWSSVGRVPIATGKSRHNRENHGGCGVSVTVILLLIYLECQVNLYDSCNLISERC